MDKTKSGLEAVINKPPEEWNDEEREMLLDVYCNCKDLIPPDEREVWSSLLKKSGGKMTNRENAALDAFLTVVAALENKPKVL